VTGNGNTGASTALTLATQTGVGSSTYGDATTFLVPQFSVNSKGIITTVTNTTIPDASVTSSGLVNTTTQSFAGNKTITGTLTTTGLATTNGGITNNGTLTNNGDITISGTVILQNIMGANTVLFTDNSGNITSTGIVSASNGGSGVAGTISGVVKANLTGPNTAAVEGVDYSLVREVTEETSSISQTTSTQTITNSSYSRKVYNGTSQVETSYTSSTLRYLKSDRSVIKFYINGVRISNSAISYSAGTLTYDATANNSYYIKSGDRIQIDYYY